MTIEPVNTTKVRIFIIILLFLLCVMKLFLLHKPMALKLTSCTYGTVRTYCIIYDTGMILYGTLLVQLYHLKISWQLYRYYVVPYGT